VTFRVGSLLTIPATDGEFAGAIAFYSIIHLRPDDRAQAYAEMSRVVRPGGWLLVAFHTTPPESVTGDIMHADEWVGREGRPGLLLPGPGGRGGRPGRGRVHRDGAHGPPAMAGPGAPDAALLFAVS
jgi:SAM-dependent methyltransferase